ncbi:hypothetical protein SPRG_07977 [Saprolegnia parasitica CBS 223.65]|uniref:THH1/TOM1/TOM3 domain-containing protein n=1 Tax=Saprolegnia parasitica (strain CBS 223.65) TaxID=695850 RepID=A0A067C7T3_SAPPC|nr:hypothetical protein SPRG_07977 [Saprolegnia parasitica CBS 223.65]KDO26573.1 hypothetical protein SPRG_07977 [Saprolegnia parasitica CBS 223.65]|eukprot:XP_012202715.1 hypothetical protein SPRG_07977 [Saprolegnia parasitica CBS 223.65]
MACTFGPSHCFHETSMLMVCAYVYLGAAFFAGYIHLRRAYLREHGHNTILVPVRRVRFFPLLLLVAFGARAAWFILLDVHAMQVAESSSGDNGRYRNVVVYVPLLDMTVDVYPLGVLSWNKLATLLYVSAFTLLVQFWADMLHHTNSTHDKSSRTPVQRARPSRQRNVLVIANVWMYAVEIALLLVKTFYPDQSESTWYMNSDGWCTAFFFCGLAGALGYDAFRLRQFFDAQEHSRVATYVAERVTVLGLLCAGLFFLRAILFLSTPVASFQATATPWLFYAIPELLPGGLVLALMRVKHDSSSSSYGKDLSPTERTPLVSPENMLSV